MPLMPDTLDDFVELTLKKFRKGKWVDIISDLQHHWFFDRFVNGSKGDTEKGGQKLAHKIQVSNQDNFQDFELFGVDAASVGDNMQNVESEWWMGTDNWSYDVNEEEFQGDDETQIVDLLKTREHGMYVNIAEKMETRTWVAPTGPASSNDPRKPLGIPYWIVKNATEGFNGGLPGSWTDVGGLSPTTYPRWKNYTFSYSDYTENDLFKKMRKAVEFCHFRTPHSFAQLDKGMPDWSFATTYTVYERAEYLVGQRNDNLGNDLASFKGKPLFKGNRSTGFPL